MYRCTLFTLTLPQYPTGVGEGAVVGMLQNHEQRGGGGRQTWTTRQKCSHDTLLRRSDNEHIRCYLSWGDVMGKWGEVK